MKRHIAVIGGGAAGTAAAHKLLELGYRVTIIEKNPRLGGRIDSHHIDGVNYEMGASFVTRGSYPKTFELLKELGLDGDLRPRQSSAAVARSGKALGVTSLLGSEWLPFVTKVVMASTLGKLLLAGRKLDPAEMWGAAQYDTGTVSQALADKRQREILEYLIQPILNGYFYWKPERTSIAMLMVLAGAARQKGKTYTLKHGLQQLPERLAQGCEVMLKTEVQSVGQAAGAYELRLMTSGKADTITVDGIVCATTATVASRILPKLSANQSLFLSAVGYSSTALVARSYVISRLERPYALAFPRLEDKHISSITTDSAASGGGKIIEVIKTYGSGEVGAALCALPDRRLLSTLRVAQTIDGRTISQGPIATDSARWPEALPEFNVGHIKRIRSFHDGAIEAKDSRLVLAGDYIGGPFIEGAISSGLLAAKRLHAQF